MHIVYYIFIFWALKGVMPGLPGIALAIAFMLTYLAYRSYPVRLHCIDSSFTDLCYLLIRESIMLVYKI